MNVIKKNLNIFFNLTKRHIILFFKNKFAIFYSFMVPVVILVIYILFLKDLEINSVNSILNEYGLILSNDEELFRLVQGLVDSWMLSGILAVSCITVSLQTNYILVRDKESGVNKDFKASPVSKRVISSSYFVFNFIVTFLINIFFMIVCFIYLAYNGEFYLSFVNVLSIIGVIILSCIISSLVTVLLSSYIKKESSLSSIVAIASTAIGFLIGAYMPANLLPSFVSNICGFFVGTYSCGLFRFVFLQTPLNNLIDYLSLESNNINNYQEIITTLQNNFGFEINVFGYNVSAGYMALILVVSIIVLILVNIFTANQITKTSEDINLKRIFKKKEN